MDGWKSDFPNRSKTNPLEPKKKDLTNRIFFVFSV